MKGYLNPKEDWFKLDKNRRKTLTSLISEAIRRNSDTRQDYISVSDLLSQNKHAEALKLFSLIMDSLMIKDNEILDTWLIKYVIDNTIRKHNKHMTYTAILNSLRNYNYIPKPQHRKEETIKRQMKETRMLIKKKSYLKEVTINRQKAFLSFVIVEGNPQLRERNKKGQFINIPDKFKNPYN